MNLLILGAPALNAAFQALGHGVVQVGSGLDSEIPLSHPLTLEKLLETHGVQGFRPDAMLHLDNGNLPQVVGMERASVPTVFYSIDTYCNPWHVPYGFAFDSVLCAQKQHLSVFARDNVCARWLPLFAAEPQAANPDFETRDVPVAFVGTLNPRNIPDREPFLRRFRSLMPLVARQGGYVPLFTRSRIVLNQTAFSEMNYRCFEATGCGAALLMEDAPDLRDLFTPGVDILPPYPRDNATVAAAIAREWLAKPQRLAEVAAAGHALVTRQHTALARAAHIAELLKTLNAEDAPARRRAELPQRRRFLSTAFAILVLELEGPTYAAHRQFYGRVYAELVEGRAQA